MNITEFLEARITEDEAWAREEDADYADTTLLPTYDSEHQANWNTERVLAECYRGQLTCNDCGDWWDGSPIDYPCNTIKIVAAVYKDHPDYQKEWAVGG